MEVSRMMDGRLIASFERRLRESGLPLGVNLWNGRSLMPAQPPRVIVTVRSPRALASLVSPTMGQLARDYVEQQIDIDGDPREMTRLGEALAGGLSAARRGVSQVRRWLRHTRTSDRDAIRHHYDVGDAFFALWLDRRRVYSCAYFRCDDDDLDTAQEQKLDHICRKLMLRPGQRFLDIGCGWGALVIWAAQHYGVRATGITLSRNQYEYARSLIRDAGVEACCEVRLMDYRDLPENVSYDCVASVGMFEHVGVSNLPSYFGKIARLLVPGGLVLNHGITLTAPDRAAVSGDIGEFIEDYVFPGGELTHISRVLAAMSGQGLEPWDVESLRPHYARTLWHWVDRLDAGREAALAQVGEKAYRIWRIYMAGSAYAFERGWMSVYQVIACRPGPDGHWRLPQTRDHIYAK